jgi:hypothetical protein
LNRGRGTDLWAIEVTPPTHTHTHTNTLTPRLGPSILYKPGLNEFEFFVVLEDYSGQIKRETVGTII